MSTQGGTVPDSALRQRGNGTKYVLLAVLAVAFLATGGIFVRQSGLSPINTGLYRMLFSIPLLWPLAYGRLGRLSGRFCQCCGACSGKMAKAWFRVALQTKTRSQPSGTHEGASKVCFCRNGSKI